MTITLEEFIEYLSSSGLLSDSEAHSFLERLPPGQRPEDPQELVRELVEAKKLTAYQATALFEGRPTDLVLGDYVLLEKLGAGGMGVVFKARHHRMKRLVALKVITPALIRSVEAVRRFQREVEAVAKLDHPNIVRAYDAREQGGNHYLVMEYVEGITLSDLLKQEGPFPAARAIDYIAQAARGLEHAHQRGIIHRDIKPQNLLVDLEGTVKILDMGLARFRHAAPTEESSPSDELTQIGSFMGSIDYMSPEQANDFRTADHRSDFYSLGCSLYSLLTGRPVYPGPSIQMKLVAHASVPIPSLREARPDAPESLEAVYRRLVAKHPEERYQSADEVVRDLELCVQTQGGQATADAEETLITPPVGDAWPGALAGGSRTTRTAPSSQRLSLWAGAALLLVLGLIAVSGWRRLHHPVWLPLGYRGAEGAKLVSQDGRKYYERIVRTFPDGTRVELVLVPRVRPDDPATFYIMENKVWNHLVRLFVHEHPDAVDRSDRGWQAGTEGDRLLPAFGMTVEEADRCAKWLGGLLPSVKQWNKAAGLYEKDRGAGPFRIPSNGENPEDAKSPGIAIKLEKPLEVGRARRDVSPFGCRDMAGNGMEWTRDVIDPPGSTVPLSNHSSSSYDVFVRGNSFESPSPLLYSALDGSNMSGILPSTDRARDVGFRAVIEPKP